MPEWIFETLEYKNWGFNSLTIGFLGTIMLTGIEGWGLVKQKESIWDRESGESVSVMMFSFLLFFMFTFFIYGIYIKSFSVAFNGFVLGILHIPIILGLWKFKGFSRLEKKWFILTSLMIPLMIFLPWKDETYLVLAFITLFAASTQPWEIWKNDKAGAVDIRLLTVYLISTIFWMIYAFSIGEMPLKITTSATLIILIVTIRLWFKCGK